MKKTNKIREKVIGLSGGVSGILSFLGSYQVCHNICLILIAMLALIGISVVGMPLLFLTKVALPFWIIAFLLLLVTLFIYFKRRCISGKIMLFNSGLVIAGVPFKQVQSYSFYFMIIGGLFVLVSLIIYVKEKYHKRH